MKAERDEGRERGKAIPYTFPLNILSVICDKCIK
jgi:hypothetical protein